MAYVASEKDYLAIMLYGNLTIRDIVSEFDGLEAMTIGDSFGNHEDFIGYSKLSDVHYDSYADGFFIKLEKESIGVES